MTNNWRTVEELPRILRKPIEEWLFLVLILCSYAELEIYWCGGSRAWWEASSPEMDKWIRVSEVLSSRRQGVCFYSPSKWIWAVGSNQYSSHDFPWSFRLVEHDLRGGAWLALRPGRAPKGGGRAPCPRARSVFRLFPWLLDSSRCWIIARHVNISM